MKKKENIKIVVVLPAFNAYKTLKKTIDDIPEGFVDEIICVDDGSTDGTYDLAKDLNLIVYKHESNRGYGANQKTCYDKALERGADIIVMLHPDYQYDPKLVSYFVSYISDGYFDIMLGSRIRSRKEVTGNGMPLYKYLGNRFLTRFENFFTGLKLSEYHTGYRAYSRKVLENINYHANSDDFIFDQEFLVQAVYFNYKIGEIPVPVRYFPDASSINFSRSVKYGLGTLSLILKFFLKKINMSGDKRFLKKNMKQKICSNNV
ncbi:MAG: glycosyltransferase family 2 protein [Acidobacteriota bacterium]